MANQPLTAHVATTVPYGDGDLIVGADGGISDSRSALRRLLRSNPPASPVPSVAPLRY